MTEPLPTLATVLLVERAQGDDAAALEQLFGRFLPRVRRIAAIRLGRTSREFADVDDVAQEALLDAFRGLEKFDITSDGRLCNWLAKIVENRIRMTIREGRADKRGGGRVARFADNADTFHGSRVPGIEATPSEHAAGAELADRVQQNLPHLSERFRDVIVYRYFCDMSYDEIAEEMSLGGANVARSLYSKALKELGARILPAPEEP